MADASPVALDERQLIRHAVLDPASTLHFSPRQWDVLIRQGRRASLLARLAHGLNAVGCMDAVPAAPAHHLRSAQQVANRQAIAVRWEVACIQTALRDVGVPITLLKGAAYLMAELPHAQGRIFSDVDILVPKHAVAEVESALMLSGWQHGEVTAYDQRYYRQWMHEIPPMTHVRRGTTIDVHHTILPDTARIKVNTPALFEAVQPLPDHPGMAVLTPVDMLLHSATHLFHEGEFENGLRDLFDLDGLLRHFGKESDFWTALVPRALTLGLTRPLFYALRYTHLWLSTPVPPDVMQAAQEASQAPAWRQPMMDACYAHVLRPVHMSSELPMSGLARVALYARSHWLRMPLHLLTYHLVRKAVVRPKPPEPPATPVDDAKQALEATPR
jgi:Uncharacterised nucleotidyltransferase